MLSRLCIIAVDVSLLVRVSAVVLPIGKTVTVTIAMVSPVLRKI